MGENSTIEWTDHTFNPWIGCSKVHEGCRHCYAETLMDTRYGKAEWGAVGTRVMTSEASWRKPIAWNKEAAKAGVRRKVFCASLADVFEDWQGPMLNSDGTGNSITDDGTTTIRQFTMADARSMLFRLIDATPWLDWLLLTKRPENSRRMWPTEDDGAGGKLASAIFGDFRPGKLVRRRTNVWLGTSISDQASADNQIPELLKCRNLSPVLFLSIEPLLGPIDLGLSSATCDCCDRWKSRWVNLPSDVTGDWPVSHDTVATRGVYRAESNRHGALSVMASNGKLLGIKPGEFEQMGPIDWVIVGGESGPGARPMHPGWVRLLRNQCEVANVPFFFKQWGDWYPLYGTGRTDPDSDEEFNPYCWLSLEGKTAKSGSWPDAVMLRLGKTRAGRHFDGREWNEFPEVVQ